MIHTDGTTTIANAVARMEDLPVELLSDREQALRAEDHVVDQVIGESCYFCGSEAAEFVEGDDIDDPVLIGCPDCGYDAPESQMPRGVDPLGMFGETVQSGESARKASAAFASYSLESEDPGPMSPQQEAFDSREQLMIDNDRGRVEAIESDLADDMLGDLLSMGEQS